MRRIAVLVVGVLLALVVPLAPSRASTQDALSRVELHITSTSDWAAAGLHNVYVLGRRVLSQSSGSSISENAQGFTLRGTGSADATVLYVVKVPAGTSPVLRLSKGWIGTAQVTLTRANTSPVDIASLSVTRPATDASTTVSASAVVGAGASTQPVDPRHLVLAFYYPWFDASTFDQGLWWEKPTGPYATEDPAAVRAMVDQARSAGVDGFVVSWDGSQTNSTRFDLVAAAAGSGFAVAPYLELRGTGRTLPDIDAMLAPLIPRLAGPSILRTPDGRPVLFVYGSWSRTPAEWSHALDTLAANGIRPFVVGDSLDTRFGFDGYHLYNPNGINDGNLPGTYANNAQKLRVPNLVDPSVPPKLWAATVSPGENDTFTHPTSPTIRNRAGGGRYDTIWKAALASQPEWVMITSWNEWYETTQISPGTRSGGLALQQTTGWSGLFHGS